MAVTWNEDNAAHLFRRSGFGADPKTIQKAVKLGMDKTVDAILKVPPKPADKIPAKGIDTLEDLQAWWLRYMVRAKSPFQERMTLFWHNHFATGFAKVNNIEYMHRQNQTLRRYGLGKFRDLITAASKDPAMVIWLDNNTNQKGKPNANFARELNELFTTGVFDTAGNPNYTEADVTEAARCFTGWTVQNGEFFFNLSKHDTASKSFKGQTGNFDGTDIINFLAVDLATTRRIPRLLFSYFAYPVTLADTVLDELQALYFTNDTAILPIVRRIFTMDEFYSAQSMDAGVREPAVFLVSALRAMKALVRLKGPKKTPIGQDLARELQELGQSLFDPPSVFGWDYGLAWTDSAGMLERAKTADWISEARDSFHPLKFKTDRILGAAPKKLTAAEMVQRALDNFKIPNVAASTKTALADYLMKDDSGTPVAEIEYDKTFVDKKVRGLIALLLSMPEAQKE